MSPLESDLSTASGGGLAVVRLLQEGGSLPIASFVLSLDPGAAERVYAHVLTARGRRPRRDLVIEIEHVTTEPARRQVEHITRALAPLGVRVVSRAHTPAGPEGALGRDPFGLDLEFRKRWVTRLRFLVEQYWRVTVSGIEHVPDSGPVIVAGNHAGAVPVDALMLGMALELRHSPPRMLRVLYDRFVDGLPLVGEVYRRLGGVTASFDNGLCLLRRGDAVGVFPEGIAGTQKPWTERYLVGRFHSGAARLAIETGAPLVPVAITGAGGAYPVLFCSKPLGEALGLPWLPVTPLFPALGLAGALPLPTRCRMTFCPPIDIGSACDGDEPTRVALVTRRLREAITGALCDRVDTASGFERLAMDLTSVHPRHSRPDD
jgi:1-acyl-sn-glycerol-3-phosphate acyltransferase